MFGMGDAIRVSVRENDQQVCTHLLSFAVTCPLERGGTLNPTTRQVPLVVDCLGPMSKRRFGQLALASDKLCKIQDLLARIRPG